MSSDQTLEMLLVIVVDHAITRFVLQMTVMSNIPSYLNHSNDRPIQRTKLQWISTFYLPGLRPLASTVTFPVYTGTHLHRVKRCDRNCSL